jgi:hypothetical protein
MLPSRDAKTQLGSVARLERCFAIASAAAFLLPPHARAPGRSPGKLNEGEAATDMLLQDRICVNSPMSSTRHYLALNTLEIAK